MSNSSGASPKIAPEDWDRVARYLAGEAEPREAESIRRWLQADPERLAMVNALESALANVSREESDDTDIEGALRNVKARFDRARVIPIFRKVGPTAPSRILSAYLRAAAVLFLLVGGGLLWREMRVSSNVSRSRTFSTTVGERRQFSLADGTEIVLGPASRLVIDPNSNDRSVTLDGDGYFKVEHDASHPFTVKVGAVKIQDVGTAFAIQSDDSAGIRISVHSGSVALGARETDGAAGEVLRDRDRATVNPSGLVAVERSAVSDDDLAWVQGRLVFRDAPLIQVGAELYRWYGVRLRVADSSMANLHLTASFSGESVDRVLNVIALSLGARVERQGDVATLYRANASGIRR
ncbi:MAG: FecR domain-containing protein [Gemmatimonadota bacterium]|nr:FecR domain-containing protein [Gemmatimonadota bacterium]